MVWVLQLRAEVGVATPGASICGACAHAGGWAEPAAQLAVQARARAPASQWCRLVSDQRPAPRQHTPESLLRKGSWRHHQDQQELASRAPPRMLLAGRFRSERGQAQTSDMVPWRLARCWARSTRSAAVSGAATMAATPHQGLPRPTQLEQWETGMLTQRHQEHQRRSPAIDTPPPRRRGPGHHRRAWRARLVRRYPSPHTPRRQRQHRSPARRTHKSPRGPHLHRPETRPSCAAHCRAGQGKRSLLRCLDNPARPRLLGSDPLCFPGCSEKHEMPAAAAMLGDCAQRCHWGSAQRCPRESLGRIAAGHHSGRGCLCPGQGQRGQHRSKSPAILPEVSSSAKHTLPWGHRRLLWSSFLHPHRVPGRPAAPAGEHPKDRHLQWFVASATASRAGLTGQQAPRCLLSFASRLFWRSHRWKRWRLVQGEWTSLASAVAPGSRRPRHAPTGTCPPTPRGDPRSATPLGDPSPVRRAEDSKPGTSSPEASVSRRNGRDRKATGRRRVLKPSRCRTRQRSDSYSWIAGRCSGPLDGRPEHWAKPHWGRAPGTPRCTWRAAPALARGARLLP
mmetsp:Transcript_51819/g.137019  ORF Transcript_51819/g.137019 Transcript_51819/m.137019 type:complete len:565 (-) Transcript_51819:3-1697(-)